MIHSTLVERKATTVNRGEVVRYGLSVTGSEVANDPAFRLWRKARRYAYSDYGKAVLAGMFPGFDPDHFAGWPFGVVRLSVERQGDWSEAPLIYKNGQAGGELFILIAWPCPADLDQNLDLLAQFAQPGTAVIGWSITSGRMIQLTDTVAAGALADTMQEESIAVWYDLPRWGTALYRKRLSYARSAVVHGLSRVPADGCSPGVWVCLDGLNIGAYIEQVKPLGRLSFHTDFARRQFVKKLFGEIRDAISHLGVVSEDAKRSYAAKLMAEIQHSLELRDAASVPQPSAKRAAYRRHPFRLAA